MGALRHRVMLSRRRRRIQRRRASKPSGSIGFVWDMVGMSSRKQRKVCRKKAPRRSSSLAATNDKDPQIPNWRPQVTETATLLQDVTDNVSAKEELEFPHLRNYQRANMLSKGSGKAGKQEAARYYGGASGSKSAIHTNDGHLTKFGAKQVCVVCLKEGDHRAWECPMQRCFVCFEIGHEVRACPLLSTKCGRCGRKGHTDEGCIRSVLIDASYRINWACIRCIRCGDIGHPSCARKKLAPVQPGTAIAHQGVVVEGRDERFQNRRVLQLRSRATDCSYHDGWQRWPQYQHGDHQQRHTGPKEIRMQETSKDMSVQGASYPCLPLRESLHVALKMAKRHGTLLNSERNKVKSKVRTAKAKALAAAECFR